MVDWTEGETVKNTVARYPSITPTSDEVTKFDESTAATTYMVGSNVGTNDQLDDLRKTLSSTTPMVECPVDAPPSTVGVANGNVIVYVSSGSIIFSTGTPSLSAGTMLRYEESYDGLVWGETKEQTIENLVSYSPWLRITLFSNGNPLALNLAAWKVTSAGAIVLTLASSDGLPNFSDGMNVTQSGSGYTPVTSAITSTDIGTFPDPNEDKNVVFNATGKDTAPRSGINYFSTSTLPVDATLAEVSSIIEPYNSTLHYSTWISDTPDNQASWTKVGNFTRTENIKKEWFDSKQYVCFCPYLTEPAASSGVPVVQMRDIGLVVSGIKLTLTDDKDLANFRVGDAIIQNDANLSDPSYSQFAVIDSGGAANVAPPDRPSRLFDGDLTSFPGGYTNNVYYYTFPEISQLAFTTLEIHGKRDTANQTSDVLVNGISIKDQLPTTNGWVTITGITSPLQTLTIVLTKEPETPLGGGTVNQLNAIRLDGTILIDGPDIWPKGDIASIDASNNTLTLSNAEAAVLGTIQVLITPSVPSFHLLQASSVVSLLTARLTLARLMVAGLSVSQCLDLLILLLLMLKAI